jgi:allantoinase
MRLGMQAIEDLTGEPAAGLVHRPRQPPDARRLVDDGGFAYDSDYYGDDLPFWMKVRQAPTAPWCPTWSCRTRWTPTTCASRCRRGFRRPTRSSTYLRDSFDALYAEGDPDGLDPGC